MLDLLFEQYPPPLGLLLTAGLALTVNSFYKKKEKVKMVQEYGTRFCFVK